MQNIFSIAIKTPLKSHSNPINIVLQERNGVIYNKLMRNSLPHLLFLPEILINGGFIFLCLLSSSGNIPTFWNPLTIDRMIHTGAYLVPFAILITAATNAIQLKNRSLYIRNHFFTIIVLIPLLITLGDTSFALWLSGSHLISPIVSLSRTLPLRLSSPRGFPFGPAQLVLFSFLGVILLGTSLLSLPFATTNPGGLRPIDALFMATSATCVTGLTTQSLATELSLFGQLVVLALIQIGGLSIMTLYSSMTIMVGRSMGMKDKVIMKDLIGFSDLENIFTMISKIVKYTVLIELGGAAILTFAFFQDGFAFSQALYYGIFHSISAFCNAGFTLFEKGLESYATSPLVNVTIAALITAGGLGFIVISELKQIIFRKKSLVRISLHSKVVIITSVFLTLSGCLIIFFWEYLDALDAYNLWEKIQIALFQSVTLRTAGFNTIPITDLNSHTLYVMTLFMFIGGSPGSTAGGIKTTTLAILIQSIITTIKGRGKVTLIDRSVSTPIVVKAIALAFISILITSLFIFIMMWIEPEQSFLSIFFEVISASGTVGLTLGITPFLSVFGKLAIAVLMLIGRIGPLTLILAVGQRRSATRGKFDYPIGQIMIG